MAFSQNSLRNFASKENNERLVKKKVKEDLISCKKILL